MISDFLLWVHIKHTSLSVIFRNVPTALRAVGTTKHLLWLSETVQDAKKDVPELHLKKKGAWYQHSNVVFIIFMFVTYVDGCQYKQQSDLLCFEKFMFPKEVLYSALLLERKLIHKLVW